LELEQALIPEAVLADAPREDHPSPLAVMELAQAVIIPALSSDASDETRLPLAIALVGTGEYDELYKGDHRA